MAKQAQLDEVRPVLNKANKAATKVAKAMDVVDSGVDKATDILEEGLEVVADVVPEVLDKGVHVTTDGVRDVAEAMASPRRMFILLSVGGAVVGAGLGVGAYFALKKKLERKYQLEFEAKMDAEIDAMRIFYAKRNKGEGFESPMDAAVTVGAPTLADAAGVAAAEYAGDQQPVGVQKGDPRDGANNRTAYHKIRVSDAVSDEAKVEVVETVDPVVADEPVRRNAFETRTVDGWNQDLEEQYRNEMLPYVISLEEHNENAFEHEQNTLTYYAEDDMVLDERDQPIEDVEALIGSENLKLFGHGSGSADTVYVRNEPKEMDLEILRREGSYAEHIFGGGD